MGGSHDDDGGSDHGAVWVLFLDDDLPCPADLNNDGLVNDVDLSLLLGAWGRCP